ncbi:hypothetical protein J3R83DRAFT_2391 [Lanmaoa asiatica]|nr:hypothetical protein J3R83DRAFT_2391 [Lanmaoa asiatica]
MIQGQSWTMKDLENHLEALVPMHYTVVTHSDAVYLRDKEDGSRTHFGSHLPAGDLRSTDPRVFPNEPGVTDESLSHTTDFCPDWTRAPSSSELPPPDNQNSHNMVNSLVDQSSSPLSQATTEGLSRIVDIPGKDDQNNHNTSKSWFKRILGPTFPLNADDIVVFMVGPSGGGKSWFIAEVTNSGLVKVGKTLRPCTAKVEAIRCELTEEAKAVLGASGQNNIVFVDTPSFHTGTGEDQGAEKNITQWLSHSKSKSTLVGTIYVDRVENNPSYESTTIQDYLNGFAYTFPQDFFALPCRLHGLLSYEGVLREDKIKSRMGTFQAQLDALRPSPLQGGRRLKWHTSSYPSRFQQGDHESAWQAVVALFSSRA